MKLTEIQKKMLKNLLESAYDYYYGYWLVGEGIEDKKAMKKEMKGLREMGLVDFKRGLMNDDGEVCGSGFQIFYGKREDVEELLRT